MSTVIFMFGGITLIVGIVVAMDLLAGRKARRAPKN
jgi:hypothetical protein